MSFKCSTVIKIIKLSALSVLSARHRDNLPHLNDVCTFSIPTLQIRKPSHRGLRDLLTSGEVGSKHKLPASEVCSESLGHSLHPSVTIPDGVLQK